MRVLKWLAGMVLVYVLFVIAFEAGYLGMMQPSFADNGIPMLRLTTTNDRGESRERMLARMETEEAIYVSAHHWPRGWYHAAVAQPDVRVEIDGTSERYRAVPVTGAEHERVSARFPLPFAVRFLMGFPPSRDILRLDPEPAPPDPNA